MAISQMDEYGFDNGFDGSASLDPSYKNQHGRNIGWVKRSGI